MGSAQRLCLLALLACLLPCLLPPGRRLSCSIITAQAYAHPSSQLPPDEHALYSDAPSTSQEQGPPGEAARRSSARGAQADEHDLYSEATGEGGGGSGGRVKTNREALEAAEAAWTVVAYHPRDTSQDGVRKDSDGWTVASRGDDRQLAEMRVPKRGTQRAGKNGARRGRSGAAGQGGGNGLAARRRRQRQEELWRQQEELLKDTETLGIPTDWWWVLGAADAVMYFSPVGGLSNRLRSIATLLTAAADLPAWAIRIVFDGNNGAYWNDYFSEPLLGLDSPYGDSLLPSGGHNLSAPGCTYEWVNRAIVFEQVFNLTKLERLPGGAEVRCLQSWNLWLPDWPDRALWFYRALKPSPAVQKLLDDFQAKEKWAAHDWVGVHVRRTDHLPKMADQLAARTGNASCSPGEGRSVFPIQRYIERISQVVKLRSHSEGDWGQPTEPGKSRPLRFFIASDDFEAEQAIRAAFPPGLTAALPKTKADPSQTDVTANRYTKIGQQEALADMLLLASTQIFIGTQGSTYSGTVKWLSKGQMFFMNVEPELTC